jgi:hypothetical protein
MKYADVNIGLTVSFEDNGEDDLPSQALAAAEEALSITSFNFVPEVVLTDIVGKVRDTASVDTHPKDGDVEQAPLVSGAVPKADAQGKSHD